MADSGSGSKRTIIVNPDEPRAGDHAYSLYNKAHPITGERDVQNYLRRQLRGLSGQEITFRINGYRQDEDGNTYGRFTEKRSITLNRYSDAFGPGSAYASALHSVRERDSSAVLVVHSITIEVE